VEVDVPECDRSNVGQDFIARDLLTARFSPLEYLMKLPCVVGDDGVGQQCKGVKQSGEILSPFCSLSMVGSVDLPIPGAPSANSRGSRS
jgi:hypothetical protein